MTSLHGDPVAIVLATGECVGFERVKWLEPIGEMAMIERVVDAHRRAKRVHDVVLVHGPGHAGEFSWLRGTHLHLVEDPEPEATPISSIRAALHSTWIQGRDFLVHRADVPFVTAEIIDRVVSTFLARDCAIVLPCYQGLRGCPGMYAARLTDEFFLHGSTRGEDAVLNRHRAELVRLRVHDPDVCFQIATPEDLAVAEDAGARWARVEAKVEYRGKA